MEDKVGNIMAVNPRSNDLNISRNDDEIMDVTSDFTDFLDTNDNVECQSELDRYLSEPCERGMDDDFDILVWWKQNSQKYKVLSKMAKDILAIPLSTVASESAFSTGGRVLDSSRSSLAPKTVEVLICLQNWIRSSPIDNIEEIINGPVDDISMILEENKSQISELC